MGKAKRLTMDNVADYITLRRFKKTDSMVATATWGDSEKDRKAIRAFQEVLNKENVEFEFKRHHESDGCSFEFTLHARKRCDMFERTPDEEIDSHDIFDAWKPKSWIPVYPFECFLGKNSKPVGFVPAAA